MPLPTPNDDESHDDFIERCMGSDVMVEDFDDEKQRYAVCQSQWDKDKERDMAQKEVRVRPVSEVRAITDEDGTRKIEGYAIRFNEKSEDLGGFREVMAPGSVKLSDDLRANFDHQTQYILGRTSAGTLETKVDDDGVWMRAYPPETTWANDMITSIERGDINQCSFEFYALDDKFEKRDGEVLRTVLDANVVALSVVAVPAYPTTSVHARDMAKALEDIPAEEGEPEQEAETDDAGRGLHQTPISITA